MNSVVPGAIRALLFLGVGFQSVFGQVVINEFVAAPSTRLLQREAGVYPKVGTTTPWQHSAYDDSLWHTGAGPFGFGAFSGVTIATDVSGPMQNRAASLYLRQTFTVSPAQAASGAPLQLLIRYNDGFIAFINGVEVARRNMGNPGMFAFHDQTAFNTNGPNPGLETIGLGTASSRLVAGENILCIQAHNQAFVGSAAADFLLEANLQISGGATLVTNTATWKYFPGLAEPSGGVLDYGLYHQYLQQNSTVAWAAREFNDAIWPIGPGPVGIEGANPPDYALGVNLYAQTYNITPSIYTRRVFSITPTEAASTNSLRFKIDYDDGVIIYLNGREILRRNVGSAGIPTPHTATASGSHNANGDNGGTVTGQEEIVLTGSPKEWLSTGDNVLAVQLHGSGLTGSDAIARVTLETTGAGARVLCQPTDAVRYFVGVDEPVVDGEQDDLGAPEETPEADNDWVELYNAGETEVSLAGWSLTDDAASIRKWMFPTNTTIPAGGYLLVLTTGLEVTPAQGATYLHANFGLSSQGEYLGLVNAEGTVVNELAPSYPPQSYLYSYGRDAGGNWGFFALATPGATNAAAALLPAPGAPVFSVPGGFHDAGFALTISTPTPGATIRYTLDGSEPNPGLLYNGPITIAQDRVVRARAVLAGAMPSPTITHTYLLNETAAKRSLPALCLTGDPTLTFYGPNTAGGPALGEGIFAIKGGTFTGDVWTANGDPAAFHYPMLRGRASEKPAALEYFPLAGAALRTDFGLRISGSSWSRPRYRLTDVATTRFNPGDPTQKPSFNLFFRSEWGGRPLDYPFFGDSPVTRFRDVRVRAGKNDITNPFIKDELIRRLFIGMGQQGSVGTFNTVYVNGVFKGYYNLCERLREGFMQEHHQSSEAWDVQQVNEFSSGDPINWNKMIAYLRSANLANPAAYQQVHDYLDVDNFIDYLLVNAFAGMWDWPNNNWVAARERSASGRWRFYVWDAEGGFGASSRTTAYNTFTSDLIIADAQTTTSRYIPALYTLLQVSPEFRLRFADRAQKHFFNGGSMVKTNMQSVYLNLRNTINPIMQETIGATVNEEFYIVWLVSDIRRNNFFTQLTGQSLWSATLAPGFSHYGGTITPGLSLTLSNPNGSGTIYYTTNGADPRAAGGAIAGQAYSGAIPINVTTTVNARVCSLAGVWSPIIEARFVVPPPAPTFLPAGSGDWTANENWSSTPAAYPNTAGSTAMIPPPGGADRNVNLRAPVTIGQLIFPQADATTRNRLRDQGAGNTNTLTFQSTNGPARIEVGGTGAGYVEFEVLAGITLQSDLRLHVTNIVGNFEHGALRLRENWSGPGGLIKSGPGVVALTGAAKNYTGPTLIEAGVLLVTQPATPTASPALTVQSGGQLRLISASDANGARIYTFGGPLSLAGFGRGPEIPESQALGKLGALRYDPGGADNQAVVTNPILFTSPTDVHVDGARNELALTGPLSGSHPLTKTGGGNLRLAADNAAYTQPIQLDNGELILAGVLGSDVDLAAPAVITGSGAVGALSGGGTLALHGLLQAHAVTGLTQQFVFTKTGSPNYALPAAASNGVLVLPTVPVAPQTVALYLATTPTPGDYYRGGFFVPFSANLAAALGNMSPQVFIPAALGTHLFENQTWSQLSAAQITTVAETADFGGGPMAGRILEIRIGGAPATFAAWQAAAFPNPADLANPLVSGPGADPLASGVPNLLRYALGLPLPGDGASAAPQFVGTAAAPAIRFPFDGGRNDIAYVVEATTNLADWATPTILFDSRTDFPPEAESGWITVTDPLPAAVQKFYRLRVFRLE